MMLSLRSIIFLYLCVFSSVITIINSTNLNSTAHAYGSIVNLTNAEIQRYDSHQVDIFQIIDAFHTIETFISNNEHLNQIDNGIFDMFNNLETTSENPSTCMNDTERLIVDLIRKKSWAVQFFDATGKPGPSLTRGWLNFVGNFDQCTSATAPSELSPDGESAHKFHGRYFQVMLSSPSFPILIQLGLCLPDSCSEEEVKTTGRGIIKATNFSFSIASVHHLTNSTQATSATITATVILSIIGLMVVLGTMFDFVFVQFPIYHKETIVKKPYKTTQTDGTASEKGDGTSFLDDQQPEDVGIEHVDEASGTTSYLDNIVTRILMSFSVYSNGKKILNVSQAEGSLESIHGIRFFSINWVVLAHTFAFAQTYAINVAGGSSKFMYRWTFDVVANSFTSVDTFFTLSGLLTSYITIRQLFKKGLKLNWPMFYFHRFWRLTPPYMLVILVYLGFQQYFIKGPLRNFEQPIDKTACETHWWTNLLYINNVVESHDVCFGHSWYLSNDMQFFILSPLMMIPFYFHRLAGLCSCFVFLLATWIATGILSTVNEWPPTGPNLKDALRGEQKYDWLHEYYTKPWCRIGPFIIGIVAGYILTIHKERPIYMKGWVVALGWMTSSVSAVAIVYGLRGDITGDYTSSVGAAALYNSVGRSVWGACVSWVIVACAAGYGGPVNALLSWSPFVVLGRLSYMVYLIHVPMIFIFYQNLDQLFYINDTTMVIYYLGFLVASNLIAFVFVLGLESPMIGLEKVIFKKEKQDPISVSNNSIKNL